MFSVYMMCDHFTEKLEDCKTEKEAIEFLEFLAEDVVWTADEEFQIVWKNEDHKNFKAIAHDKNNLETMSFSYWIEEEENEEDDF